MGAALPRVVFGGVMGGASAGYVEDMQMAMRASNCSEYDCYTTVPRDHNLTNCELVKGHCVCENGTAQFVATCHNESFEL